jgi:hypothetical protein
MRNEFIKPFVIENDFDRSLKWVEMTINSLLDRIEIGQIEQGIDENNIEFKNDDGDEIIL